MGWPQEGLLPNTLEGKYFLQRAPGLTSCHDQVVSRVVLWCYEGCWLAWMVMSVTRQGVQVGCCVGTTRPRCSRGALLLGRSVATGEVGLSSVFLPGTKQVLQDTLSCYSPVDVYLSWQITLYLWGSCYFTWWASIFNQCAFLFFFFYSPLISAYISIPIFLYFSYILYFFLLFSCHLFISF